MATIHTWERYGIYSYFGDISSSDTVSLKSSSSTTYDRYVSNYVESGTVSTKSSNLTTSHYISYNGADYKVTDTSWGITASKITSYNVEKGTYIDVVESENTSAYPENGEQDGYWYVYEGSYDNFEPSVFATIDGVQRKLTSIPAMVDGVQRELTSLFATIDGVAREIFAVSVSGKPLSKYSIGDVVYINESGTPTAFYVAGHNYESGLNGAGRTLLVRKDAYERRQWHTSQSAIQYSQSSVDAYLTGTYHLLFSDSVRSLMGETTIYSTTATGTSITIKRPVFLLSAREVIPEGYNVYSGLYSEGSPVPLSSDCFFFIINSMWGWLRTKGTSTAHAGYLGSEGDSSILMNNTANIYPALTLPSTANFDPSTDVLLEGAFTGG